MKSTHVKRIRLIQIVFSAAIVFALLQARETNAREDQKHPHLVTDWSHRHLIYSEPHSLMKRFQLSTEPRYVQQWLRQNAEKSGGQDAWRWHHAPENPNRIQGDWSMNMGSGATVGAGNYPAKYTFDATTASCASDFVVYNTSLGGSSSQASIVAFNNIYAGTCTTPNPSTYWAYNTGSGAIVTSPVLSYDGTQVAFVQSTAGAANLVILRWKANDGTLASPLSPSAGPCTAGTSCIITVPLSTATVTVASPSPAPSFTCTGVDSHSSPFYDYGQDVLYVGDDSGCLHKFTGVFLGTPTEVLSSGANIWPAALNGGFGHLNSPVYADGYGQVLVTGSDGVLYSVDTTMGGVYVTGTDYTPKLASTGFDDGPLVDLTEGYAYIFARADNANSVAGVFQFAIPAAPSGLHNDTGTEAVVSNSATIPASAFYIGTFDNLYYTTGTGTGNLYACSTSGTVNAIWGIEINSNVMNTPTVGPTISTSNVGCSPITEFYNTDTNSKQIFLSVAGSAVTTTPISCPSTTGCVMSFDIGSPLLSTSGASATATEAGGTSGIVVDNSSTTTGADQVYFTPLSDQACVGAGGVGTGTGGCAIQASQSALR